MNAADSLGGPEDGLGRLADALADGRLDADATPESLAAEFDVPREAAERALRAARALASALDDGVAWEDGARGPADDDRPELPADFELLDRIGQGGMGVVWRARQKSLDRVVAVKVLRPGERTFGPALRRFEREARALARLRHPHVVAVHEVGAVNGGVYFTMDFVDGRSLAAEFAEGPATPSRAVRVLKQIASAVAWVHAQGFLHRDLKPGNVLLDRAGDAFVGDFGLAVDRTSDARVTQTGALVGTPAYLAPELATGRAAGASEATDVYGLGAILYEGLTGRPPFVGNNAAEVLAAIARDEPPRVRALRRDCPAELAAVAEKALARDPADRYATARALLEDLERFEAGRPVKARPPSLLRRGTAFARRHVGRLAAAAGGVAVAALVAWAVFAPRLRPPAEELVRNARARLAVGDEGGAALLFEQAAATDRAAGDAWRAEALRLRVAQIDGLLLRGRAADAAALATRSLEPFADAASLARRAAALHLPAEDPASEERPGLLVRRARARLALGDVAQAAADLDLLPVACLVAAAGARGGDPSEIGTRFDAAADRWFAELRAALADRSDPLHGAAAAAALRTVDAPPDRWNGATSFGWALRTLPVRRDRFFPEDAPAWLALEAARLRAGATPALAPRPLDRATRLYRRESCLAAEKYARRPDADAADVRAAAFFLAEARDLPVVVDVASRPAGSRKDESDAVAAVELFSRTDDADPVRTAALLRKEAFALARQRGSSYEAQRWLERWTGFAPARGDVVASRAAVDALAAELGDEDPRLALRRALGVAAHVSDVEALKRALERSPPVSQVEAARLHRLLLLSTDDAAERPVESALRSSWRETVARWRDLLDGRTTDEELTPIVVRIAFDADDAPRWISGSYGRLPAEPRDAEYADAVAATLAWSERSRFVPLARLGVAPPGVRFDDAAFVAPGATPLRASRTRHGSTGELMVAFAVAADKDAPPRLAGQVGVDGVARLSTVPVTAPLDLYGATFAAAFSPGATASLLTAGDLRRTVAAAAERAADDLEARRKAEPYFLKTPDKGDPRFELARVGALLPVPEAKDAWRRLDAASVDVKFPSGRTHALPIRHFLPAALLAGAPWPADLAADVLTTTVDLLLTGSSAADDDRTVFWARLAAGRPEARPLAAARLADLRPGDAAAAAHAARILRGAGLVVPSNVLSAADRAFGPATIMVERPFGAGVLLAFAALLCWSAGAARRLFAPAVRGDRDELRRAVATALTLAMFLAAARLEALGAPLPTGALGFGLAYVVARRLRRELPKGNLGRFASAAPWLAAGAACADVAAVKSPPTEFGAVVASTVLAFAAIGALLELCAAAMRADATDARRARFYFVFAALWGAAWVAATFRFGPEAFSTRGAAAALTSAAGFVLAFLFFAGSNVLRRAPGAPPSDAAGSA